MLPIFRDQKREGTTTKKVAMRRWTIKKQFVGDGFL